MECMVTLAMLGAFMVVAGSLARDYVQYSNRVLSSQDSSKNAAMALQSIGADVSEATGVSIPSGPALETSLAFQKPDSSFYRRLDAELPLPVVGGPPWQPGTVPTVNVTYQLTGKTLHRVATSGSLTSSKTVLEGLSEFSSRRDGEAVVVKVGNKEFDRVVSLRTEIRLWRF